MFSTILLGAWTVMHVYVFWRASSVPAVARRVSGRALALTAVIVGSTLFVSRALDRDTAGPAAEALDALALHWLAALFLVSCCLFAVDVVTAFGLAFRGAVPALRGGAFVAGGVLTASALFQGLRAPVVEDHVVRLRGLPREADGTVIVALSDLHVGTAPGPSWLEACVEQVNALRPDVVVLVGDVVEGHGVAEADLPPIFRRLAARLGVWAVTGNHDAHGEESLRLLGDGGVRVLLDEWAELRPGLVLAGVRDPGRSQSPGASGRLERSLAGRPAGAATVLLSHRPQRVDDAAGLGVGLMLCGHTHGGQIWPVTYVADAVNGWAAGRHEVGDMTLIVSRGAGTWGPRMRLWPAGEILRITLRAE
jgi:predicted MPP superfamily phosphohydrolase